MSADRSAAYRLQSPECAGLLRAQAALDSDVDPTSFRPGMVGADPFPDNSVGRIFVARERELAELLLAFEMATRGQGGLYMVTGEPGIGKTRLAQELARRLPAAEVAVLWGRCQEEGGAPAYWPWLQVLRTLLAPGPTAPGPMFEVAAARLRQGFPSLQEHHLMSPPAVESEGARFLLFDCIAVLLKRATEERVQLILLDDLHTADQSSLQLLLFIARELPRMRALIVGTYREAEARNGPAASLLLGEIARDSRRIPLRGLQRDDVRAFILQTAGAEPSETVVEAVHRTTEGNPFFLDEILRVWIAEGDRVDTADTSLLRLQIPDQVRQAIRRRLAPVAPEVRALLAAAAVIGPEFSTPLLQAATDVDADRCVALLEAAQNSGLLVRTAAQPSLWRFAHGLLRETIYDDLAAAPRAALHYRIATCVETLFVPLPGDHLSTSAHHYIRALPLADVETTINMATRAGRHAFASLAFEDAAAWFARALQLAELHGGALTQQIDLLIASSEAWYRAGEAARANEAIRRAIQQARGCASGELLGRAALAQAWMEAETGRVNQSLVDLLKEALALLPHKDSVLRAGLLGRLASALYFSAPAAERRALSETAVAMARRLNDPAALTAALRSHHFALWQPGTAAARLETSAELLQLGERLGDKDAMLQARDWRCVDLLELGDVRALRDESEKCAQLADELHNLRSRWQAALVRATIALFSRPLAECEKLMESALEHGQRAQAANALHFYAVQVFTLRMEWRRLHDLEGTVRNLIDRYPALSVWRCALAFLYGETGRPSEAARLLAAFAANAFSDLPRDANWLISMALLSEVAYVLQDQASAAALYDLLEPFAETNIVIATAAGCYGSTSRPLGLLAMTLGNWAGAERHLDDAVKANTRMGSQLWTAYAVLAQVETSIRRDDVATRPPLEDIEQRLREIDATATHLGAVRLQSKATALQREAVAKCRAVERRWDPRARGGKVPALTRYDASMWSITFRQRTIHLRDTKGVRYLAHLMKHPSQDLHVAELFTLDLRQDDSSLPATRQPGDAVGRLRQCRDEHRAAQAANDAARAAALQAEIELLLHDMLVAHSGSGTDALAAESARVSVTKAIALVLGTIGKEDPELRQYLGNSIRTGRLCSYTPMLAK